MAISSGKRERSVVWSSKLRTQDLELKTQNSALRRMGGIVAKIACCHNCIYSYWDRDHTVQCVSLGVMNWPACANHTESLGRMQRVPDHGMCANYRPRLATPEGQVKQIPLGDGFYAYVDAADYEWLSQWTCSLHGGYAGRMEKRKVILMHRQIMRPPEGMVVDHQNRNKLDNTRANLRVCTHAENARNRGKPRDASSRFIGVGYDKYSGKYYARLYHEGTSLFVGYYTDEIEAAREHDHKAVEMFGEFAQVNFPEEWPAERRAEVYARRDAVNKDGKKGGRKERKKVERKEGKREGKERGKKEVRTGGRSRPRGMGHKPRAASAGTKSRS